MATMYYPEQTYVAPLVTILRNRMLKVPGEVVAQPGKFVAASDVVARGQVWSERVLVDVAEQLGISPEDVDAIEKTIGVEVGDKVELGQAIAKRRRFLGSKTVRSPIEGSVAVIEGGRVVIEGKPENIELRAAIPGIVTEIIEGRGVQIQTVGALVQGMWGTGGLNAGTLEVIGEEFEAGDVLPGGLITLDQRSKILLTHVPLGAEALENADKHRVRGLIAPSMHASLIEMARSLDGVSLVLTEGFGRNTMTDEVYKLLKSHVRREVVLIANEPSRWKDSGHPEVFVPVDAAIDLPETLQTCVPLEVGSRVRMLRAPHIGEVGTVTALPDVLMPIENGMQVQGAMVDLGHAMDLSGDVFVPLANLELM